jgi:fructoselysine 6-kinase
MAGFDVATVGDNCVDRYLPPIGQATVGGNALNVAVHLRRLGLPTAYFGAVGNDRSGAWIRNTLAENRVDIEYLREVPGQTAFTEIGVDAKGERIIAFEEFGVCRGYAPSEAETALLLKARHLHIGWLDDGGALRRRLGAAGVSVSQDLAVNAGADGLSIAFASAGASPESARSLLDRALAEGARIAVVTRGALGSIASDGIRLAETGSAPVVALDTLGAGDTFIAGFIEAYLRGLELGACLAAGRDAAVATCRHLGGFPQRPLPLSEIGEG